MNAARNLTHLALLAMWALAGALFTLKVLFALGLVMPALAFWLWFAAFAAVTTFVVTRFEGPVAAALSHAGVTALLALVPVAVPLSFVRYGLDVLLGRI